MTADHAEELHNLLEHEIRDLRPVVGGDIGTSYHVTCTDGLRLFAKRYDSPESGSGSLAKAEAEGLSWLAEAEAIRIPEIIASSPGNPSWIVLEWIDQSSPTPSFDEELGRGLAALHASGAPNFGHRIDNFIGSLPQANQSEASWPEFYGQRRLLPQLNIARRSGRLSEALHRRGCLLVARLPEFYPAAEPPARLHGDLWSGNLIADEAGKPCLIDPAVHGGHREMDLAMMKLFGGFSSRVFDAYAEANPLLEGFEQRVALHQLYPLLIHLNLFGGSYTNAVERTVDQYL